MNEEKKTDTFNMFLVRVTTLIFHICLCAIMIAGTAKFIHWAIVS
jgi:hypothetical protein